ncbi:MAG: hypothetical protein QM767_22030 [Anaeromyxobacter sp.]
MARLRLVLLLAVPLALIGVAIWTGPPSLQKDIPALVAWILSLLFAIVWMVRWDRKHGKHVSALLGAGFAAGVAWGGLWYVLQAHRVEAFLDIFAGSTWIWAGVGCAVLLLGVFLMQSMFERH